MRRREGFESDDLSIRTPISVDQQDDDSSALSTPESKAMYRSLMSSSASRAAELEEMARRVMASDPLLSPREVFDMMATLNQEHLSVEHLRLKTLEVLAERETSQIRMSLASTSLEHQAEMNVAIKRSLAAKAASNARSSYAAWLASLRGKTLVLHALVFVIPLLTSPVVQSHILSLPYASIVSLVTASPSPPSPPPPSPPIETLPFPLSILLPPSLQLELRALVMSTLTKVASAFIAFTLGIGLCFFAPSYLPLVALGIVCYTHAFQGAFVAGILGISSLISLALPRHLVGLPPTSTPRSSPLFSEYEFLAFALTVLISLITSTLLTLATPSLLDLHHSLSPFPLAVQLVVYVSSLFIWFWLTRDHVLP